MPTFRSAPRAIALAAAALLGAAACRGDDDARTTTTTSGGEVATRDADRPDASRAAPRDADQEFLRRMSDHHEGLVEFADDAADDAQGERTKDDARRLYERQARERSTMVAMLERVYGDRHEAEPPSSAEAMEDALEDHEGKATYDAEFYRQVVRHHEEGVRMIDDYLPRLRAPEVRRMAEAMKEEQQREIREFRARLGD